MHSKFLLISHLVLFLYCVSNEIIEEDHVLIITTENFDEALEKYDKILVEFYAPWCGHCQALAPEYIKAATLLKEMNSEIRLGKVDATVEKELAQSRNIKGYPTLTFFRNKSPMEYNGPRKADGIIEWIEKKTGPATTAIESQEELDSFADTQDIVIVGFFETVSKATAFMQVARKMSKFSFGFVMKKEIFDSSLSGGEGIIVYKGFDEKKVVFDQEPNVEQIETFINIHQFELVSAFSPELSEKFFEANIDKHLIFFAPSGEQVTNDTIVILRKLAPNYRGRMLYIFVDSNSDQFKGILEFFGISANEIPCLRAVILQEEVARYKQKETDLSVEVIRTFVDDFLAGKLIPDLKSQNAPEDWNAKPVKILTSSNFNEVVLDRKGKRAFVEFYAPWCGHCKALSPIWDQLGTLYYLIIFI